MSSPTKLRQMAKELGWPPELEKAADQLQKLERENAALRTVLKRWLKVADDCHQEQQEVGYSEYNITVGLVCDTRALLDAARKETRT